MKRRASRVAFVSQETRSWKPLPENQRLDAYYHLREVVGVKTISRCILESQEEDDDDQEEEMIPADTLGELPWPSSISIEERGLIMGTLPVDDEKEEDDDEREEVKPEKKLSRKKIRPSTAQPSQPRVLFTTRRRDISKVRPQSAPPRLDKQPPIRIYQNEKETEERGPPKAPEATCTAKPILDRGHNNIVFSDVILSNSKQEIKNEEETPRQYSQSTPRSIDEQLVQCRRLITFTGTVLIQLVTVTPWSTIRYTTDGSPVNRGSQIYKNPFEISDHHSLVRACCFKRGWISQALELKFNKKADTTGLKERIMNVSRRVARHRASMQVTPPVKEIPTPREKNAAALLHAVKTQHVVRVRKLLTVYNVPAGATVEDGSDYHAETPLVAAARSKNVIITQLLLNHHADPGQPSGQDAETALHAAAKSAATRCCKLLIDKGADLEALDASGRTPLILACAHGALRCVNLLLKAGANVDATTQSGESGLHAACQCLEPGEPLPPSNGTFGSSFNALSSTGGTTASSSDGGPPSTTRRSSLERISFDRPRRSSFERTRRGSRELLRDLHTIFDPPNHKACVRLLIDGGAKLDAKFNNKRPIQFAATRSALDVVDMLRSAGAKPLSSSQKKKKKNSTLPSTAKKKEATKNNTNAPAVTNKKQPSATSKQRR